VLRRTAIPVARGAHILRSSATRSVFWRVAACSLERESTLPA
jgi:hypothetical protein